MSSAFRAHPDILVEVMVVAAKPKRVRGFLRLRPAFRTLRLLAVQIWPDAAATGEGSSQPLRGKRLTTGELE